MSTWPKRPLWWKRPITYSRHDGIFNRIAVLTMLVNVCNALQWSKSATVTWCLFPFLERELLCRHQKPEIKRRMRKENE
jgi:hypothetical protein